VTLRMIEGPTTEPVSLTEARAHLLLGADTSHDAWIAARLPHIRAVAEAATRRVFGEQKWRVSMDSFPREIMLGPTPVRSVLAVEYVNTAGTTVALVEGTDYQVDTESAPARVCPFYGTCWPSSRCDTFNAVQVTYLCGHEATDAETVGVKTWILERLATMFAFREQVTEDGKALPPPDYEALDPYRVVYL
jgi:uncharacterized phiE125 gp8 family phage protein